MDKEAMDNMFNKVDVSQDGTVSKLEMAAFLRDLFGQIAKQKNKLNKLNKTRSNVMNPLAEQAAVNDSGSDVEYVEMKKSKKKKKVYDSEFESRGKSSETSQNMDV